MATDRLSDKLAVILHADIAGSTRLVQQDEHLAHERIQNSFRRFRDIIEKYRGKVLELRGDALLAEFERASDAVAATLAFQSDQAYYLSRLKDDLKPGIRVGIAMGEVVMGDDTVTGAGVVLAQRVEQLADPGSVCITAALHEALPNRMPFELENIGEQRLKGFDDPVRVYRVELSPGKSIPPPQQEAQPRPMQQSWQWRSGIVLSIVVMIIGAAYLFTSTTPMEEPASIKHMARPLPDKPSIAVLPFTNISDDPKQEYFVDGMTEDLITDLSKLSGMFVIARNSVFTYKNKAVKIKQVASELGVRYVLEGSVRRIGEQIRINAQLIDATTGGHLWAERYDGKFKDVFAFQDQITRKIVAALSVKLSPTEEKQQLLKYTDNAQAYDEFLQGWNLESFDSPETFNRKVKHFQKAAELDPDYGHAYAALANIYMTAWLNTKYSIGLPSHEALRLAYKYISEAMKNPTPLAHRVNARMLSEKGKWDEAVAEAGIAISLNPNDSSGYSAMCDLLIKIGRPAEAKLYLAEASRLNPQESYADLQAMIQFHLERYDDAIENILDHINDGLSDEWQYLYLAASYGHLGREAEGKAAIKMFNQLRAAKGDPKPYQASRVSWWSLKDEVSQARIRDGLLKAGMPF